MVLTSKDIPRRGEPTVNHEPEEKPERKLKEPKEGEHPSPPDGTVVDDTPPVVEPEIFEG